MKDLISIIIPTYNAQDYVSDCINSILKQSYGNFEIILIDDGSTDNTKEIVGNIARNDKRIKLVFNETNMGCAYSRNLGLELHKGAISKIIETLKGEEDLERVRRLNIIPLIKLILYPTKKEVQALSSFKVSTTFGTEIYNIPLVRRVRIKNK